MLSDIMVVGYVLVRGSVGRAAERFMRDERGEGVISAAIAVLIMAFLGAAMWIIFRQILDDSGSRTDSTINNIGGDGG